MTFKMLIVDDEPIISRGLRLTIPWETINVEVVDTAHDGEDAILKVKEYRDIDVVITDVRMPKVDGLQLASFLHDNFPHIRTIILSGYDEFEYAQQAIKLGVNDYLLKPVNVEELIEKVKSLTHEIKQEQHQQKEHYEIGLRNAIIQQVTELQGAFSAQLTKYNPIKVYPFISMHQHYMQQVNNLSEGEFEGFLSEWEKLIENSLQECGYTSYSFFIKENILLTCVHGSDRKDMNKKAIHFDGVELEFVWNDAWIPVDNLKVVFAKLIHAVKFLPFADDHSIILSDQLSRTTEQPYPTELEKKILESIFQMEEPSLFSFTSDLFSYFSTHEFFLEEVVQVCRDLLTKIVGHFESLGGTNAIQWEFHLKQNINVHQYNSYKLLKELFFEDLATILREQYEFKNLDKQDLLIGKAKEYIHEYYRTNIKVNEVADVINITPNYLSSLFKQKTGVNFNEYVNKLRVDEAKILLVETPFKVSEISEQVGFHEYKYFVGVFKRFTGMTPTDYRKFMNLQD
ncbi:response regulator [Bacillus sp. HNG]|uniref:response regulator n=1 Tax=Bacillus sp. HNG TaxID=2293325 RepID=UPI000E2F5C4E|nr:response regulator [Bacillus sp. HNG]RFB17449.1 response regulator [Bacillus sp. HNG]